MKRIALVLVFLAASLLPSAAWSQASTSSQFALRDGDRVVFFGDSITEQRLYTRFVEYYVVTRFPDRKITFVNAGVGGDKVSGGWAGPIDLRLRRDIFAYEPTVITIMLGMNDGYYRPSDEGILETYEEGYRQILDKISAKAPHARLTLIKPSAFDDVTRVPQFKDGYNMVLLQMGELLGKMAGERHAAIADMNAPVVATLTAAKRLDPALATTLMFDRVHPGAGLHWVMAAALLRSWDAPAIVSAASIDAVKLSVIEASNTELTQIRKTKAGALSWVQSDRALPLPLPSKASDPVLHLALDSSTLIQDLDQQMLRVSNLRTGTYELRIDEKLIGTFTDEQLKAGINLALLDTPMLAQARLVALDAEHKDGVQATRFSLIRSPMEALTQEASVKLQQAAFDAATQEYAEAQPAPHRFNLTPVVSVSNTAAAK